MGQFQVSLTLFKVQNLTKIQFARKETVIKSLCIVDWVDHYCPVKASKQGYVELFFNL